MDAKAIRVEKVFSKPVQKTGRAQEMTTLTQKVTSLIKDHKWQEADEVADEILALMDRP